MRILSVKLLTGAYDRNGQAEGSDVTGMGRRSSEAQGTHENIRSAGAANQSQGGQSGR